MNLKKLVKMLEAETDMEKAAEVLQKIDSLIVRAIPHRKKCQIPPSVI